MKGETSLISSFSSSVGDGTPLTFLHSNNSKVQPMKSTARALRSVVSLTALAAALAETGCSSTSDKSSGATPAGRASSKAKADDGRTVDIGKSSPASSGGVNYKNPHMEKCWLADGFDFNGYDTLYIAPTLSTAKFDTKNQEEVKVHELARENLAKELASLISSRNIFANVVTRDSDIKADAKTLKLENTITEFTKGGGAARYFVGLYGGGQPVLRVQGRMVEGDNARFTFEARRSGVSAGARMTGVFMKDEDIQIQDIHSMALDLADFMSVIAGKFPRRE